MKGKLGVTGYFSSGGLASAIDGEEGGCRGDGSDPPPQRCASESCNTFLNSHSIREGFELCNACLGKMSSEERFRYEKQIRKSRKAAASKSAEKASDD